MNEGCSWLLVESLILYHFYEFDAALQGLSGQNINRNLCVFNNVINVNTCHLSNMLNFYKQMQVRLSSPLLCNSYSFTFEIQF